MWTDINTAKGILKENFDLGNVGKNWRMPTKKCRLLLTLLLLWNGNWPFSYWTKKISLKTADKFLDLGLKTNNIIAAMLLQQPFTLLLNFLDFLTTFYLPILKTVKKYLDDVPSISVTSWYCSKKDIKENHLWSRRKNKKSCEGIPGNQSKQWLYTENKDTHQKHIFCIEKKNVFFLFLSIEY